MFEIIIGVSVLTAIILGVILCRKMNLNIFGIKLSLTKSYTEQFIATRRLIEEHFKNIQMYSSNILRNQMTFLDGSLSKLKSNLKTEGISDGDICMANTLGRCVIELSLKQNGFGGFDPGQLHEYIQNKIIELRELYNHNLPNNKYIDSHDFAEWVSDVYLHALNCVTYWTDKLKEEEVSFTDNYNKLTGK